MLRILRRIFYALFPSIPLEMVFDVPLDTAVTRLQDAVYSEYDVKHFLEERMVGKVSSHFVDIKRSIPMVQSEGLHFYGKFEERNKQTVLSGALTIHPLQKVFTAVFYGLFMYAFFTVSYDVLTGTDHRWFLPLIIGIGVAYMVGMNSFFYTRIQDDEDILGNKQWFVQAIEHAVLQTAPKPY